MKQREVSGHIQSNVPDATGSRVLLNPAGLAVAAVRTTSAWITRRKYRTLASVAAIVLAAMLSIAVFAVPWIPVVGVAVAAVAVSVSKLTTRLLMPTCLSCGQDLGKEPVGVHGIACPGCGAVNTSTFVHLARLDAILEARKQSEQRGLKEAGDTVAEASGPASDSRENPSA